MATKVKEPVQEPQDTEPIPITIVRPTTKPALEVEIIRSSSRPQLTDPILEVQPPQPGNPSHTTPNPDRGEGITRDNDEPPRNLCAHLNKVHQDPDAPAHMELERKKKAYQEVKLLALSKPELIKVVTEVATKAGVDPKALQSSKGGRKRKAQELEPEVRILGLKCNRSLPEGVHSVNNMVIEHSEQGIFFIDVFGNEAFQRINS
ncbi:hypothetical protein Tco_0537631 [Tanacetum coccineum]